MIQLFAKNNYCKCNADISEFEGPNLIANASIEIKGTLYSILLREIPMFIAKTGKKPEEVLKEVNEIIPFDMKEFMRFVVTSSQAQDDNPAQ